MELVEKPKSYYQKLRETNPEKYQLYLDSQRVRMQSVYKKIPIEIQKKRGPISKLTEEEQKNYQKKYREANKEKAILYRQEHRDKMKEYKTKYDMEKRLKKQLEKEKLKNGEN